MNRVERARELRKFIKKRERVLIQTHDYPDPDAIAAAFGLCYLVEHYGGTSGVIYHGVINRAITAEMVNVLKIPIIPAAGVLSDSSDEVIVVDTRIAATNLTRLAARYIGEVDHHQGGESPGADIFHDIRPEYGSCSTIVGEYFHILRVRMPQNVATALSIGLNTDTQRLLRNVSRYDVAGYYYLYRQSDQAFLQYVLLNNIEMADLPVFVAAINNLVVDKKSFMAYTDIGEIKSGALAAIVGDFILTIKEVNVVLTACWDQERLYLSVRSEAERLPADRVIRALTRDGGTGGGHRSMAAGFIPVTAGRQKLLAAVRKEYFLLPEAGR